MISVRRARVLPPPSFRFRLATDTLGFGYDLPAAGRSRDFHPLERALAGRTMISPPGAFRWERPRFPLSFSEKGASALAFSPVIQ
jgi:hypothetical protein